MTWAPYVALAISVLTFAYSVWLNNRKSRIHGEAGATEAQVTAVKNQLSDRIGQVEQKAAEGRATLAEELFRLIGRVNMFIEMTHERAKLRVDDVHHPDPEHSMTDALLDKFRDDSLRDEREIRRLQRVMA